MTTRPAPLDFAAIASSADLPSILAAEGIAVRSGKFMCPFHPNDRTPAASVYHRDGAWRFRCHACEASGSALDWIMLREGLSVVDAARRLSGESSPSSRPRRSSAPRKAAPPPKPKAETWRDPEWQAAARGLVELAEATLWGCLGSEARGWLRWRGLDDQTMRRFRLGFLPGPVESDPLPCLDGRSIFAPRGIVIPWSGPEGSYATRPDPDTLEPPGPFCGVNVRKLAFDVEAPLGSDKCMAFAGSTRGYGFPFAEFLPSQLSRPVLLCEGELDALLAEQELGDLANVVTVGGANQTPDPYTLGSIRRCRHWLIATDHDEAGNRAAKSLAEFNRIGSRRLCLPTGVDIGDFVQGGGDLREWFRSESRRLGLSRRAGR